MWMNGVNIVATNVMLMPALKRCELIYSGLVGETCSCLSVGVVPVFSSADSTQPVDAEKSE